ncbi:uncharacterized protein LOC134232835 [Saccostrea cucullata]|uniref:uncharacterized protein LOC134232835 n=1 Tax=Saccostrea cuccullata TaxID=36930 RepID=UPI002ED65194
MKTVIPSISLIYCTFVTGICSEFSVTAYSKRLGRDVRSTQKLRGLRQCVRDCVDRGQCKAVNYDRESLQCQLLGDSITDLSQLMDDDSFNFIDVSTQSTGFPACTITCTYGVCVKISPGNEYCSVPACPMTYRYSTALNFCYTKVEVSKNFTDAYSYCKTIGCRLAVPSTMEHILFLREEFNAGYLDNDYRIGGQWDTEEGKWMWINGKTVFDDINLSLSDFEEIESSSGELIWSKEDDLSQIDTGHGKKFLCEKLAFCGEFSVTAYNKRLGRDVRSMLKLRGLRQCVRDCVDRGQCKAVNYDRESLQCQLLGDSTTDLSQLVDDEKFNFIHIASQGTMFWLKL